MSISIAIAINIIALCAILYAVRCLKISAIALILATWLICFNIPFMQWSLCAYFYALFDKPSALLVLLCVLYIMRFIVRTLQDSYLARYLICFTHKSRTALKMSHISRLIAQMPIFPMTLRYMWICYGFLLYMGVLGYGFDIYHLESKIHIFVFCALGIIAYLCYHPFGYYLIFCIVAYKLHILGDGNILESCIDPFLWIGCIFTCIAYFCKTLFLFCRRKINEKKVA